MSDFVFIGEGKAEHSALQPLAEKLLGRGPLSGEYKTWKAAGPVRPRKGAAGLAEYGKKLWLLMERADREGTAGLVVTRDHDTGQEDRERGLKAGREKARESGCRCRAAIGVPSRHFECWLLADEQAVRNAMRLPAHGPIPAPSERCECAAELDGLFETSEARRQGQDLYADILPAIARSMEFRLCRNSRAIGLQSFKKELDAEIGPLLDAGDGAGAGAT